MAFHVEIRRGLRHARVFNLNAERLHREVADPWRAGRTVALGDQEWDPADSELRVLEGPELTPPDLALGQGWNNAERSGTDVTARTLVQALTVAVLADSAETYEAARDVLGHIGAREAAWPTVRARLLEGHDLPGLAVLIVAGEPTPPSGWLFDAGVAIGALGRRAIVTRIGDGVLTGELRDLAVPLDPQVLTDRVRAAARSG